MQGETLDRRIVAVLAFGCGVAVANMYYAQPLLADIARDLDVSTGTVGLLVTAGQIGLALGFAFIVPLGDLKEPRRLVSQLFLAGVIALLATAAAPSFGVLAFALLAVGITSSVGQVIVPLSAALAAEDERGKVVGIVMSGLVIGILVARTVSGLLADIGGWRLPYLVAAGLMLVLLFALRFILPRMKPQGDLHYPSLLRSVLTLIGEEAVLRRRIVYGAMTFASFAILWTAITFLLAEQYGYGEGVIGLFGLFGILGAAAAQATGRFIDRGWLQQTTGISLALVVAGWILLAFGSKSLAVLIVGIVVLDVGIQAQQICNLNAIFGQRPDARSRSTTAYMTSNFLWAALASAASAFTYDHGGWAAVVILGSVCASIGLLAWMGEQVGRRRSLGETEATN